MAETMGVEAEYVVTGKASSEGVSRDRVIVAFRSAKVAYFRGAKRDDGEYC
jgi:hypothetical protein